MELGPRSDFFEIQIQQSYWKLAQKPFVAFSYLVPPGTTMDMQVEILKEIRRVQLTTAKTNAGAWADVDAPLAGRIASPLIADGKWHRAVIDLEALIHSANLKISSKYFWPNRLRLLGRAKPGSVLYFDNFEIVSRGWDNTVIEWTVPDDDSGIRGFRYVLDRLPKTKLEGELSLATSNPALCRIPVGGRRGTWYFHIQSVDIAGRSSETRHIPLEFLNR